MRIGICTLLVFGGIFLSGCSQKLMRENVFANTESMIGLAIKQNPKTQLYEFQAGFARHELFFVPTDKSVKYDANGVELDIQRGAGTTAQVLAEIQVGGSGKGNSGSVEIYQRLAVGEIAVNSQAAVALLAHDDATASAIANPELSAKLVTATRKSKLDQIELLQKTTPQPVTLTVDGTPTTYQNGRELGNAIAIQYGTSEQKIGNWDLMNFRIKGSNEQLQQMIDEWKSRLGL